jgi:cell division protein FtsZ
MNNQYGTKRSTNDSMDIPRPVIKVMGLGGGGSNAVNRMIELGLTGVDYIAANTDAQALKNSAAPTKIQLGPNLTRGLGAGGNPQVGEAAAEESKAEIQAALQGSDMVFVTAGMGGGTGTGSIPVAARISRALGAVTVGIVTSPFSFEMGKRQKNAKEGLSLLRQHTNTLINVPNDSLLKVSPQDLPIDLAFRLADDVLRQGIQGITQIVTQPGMINVDFSHVRNMMLNGGGALMVLGYGKGPNRAMQAVWHALNHPLLEAVSLQDATGIIANFTGGDDLAFYEVAEALNHLHSLTSEDTEIIPGINTNPQFNDRVEVILVITGMGGQAIDKKPEMNGRDRSFITSSRAGSFDDDRADNRFSAKKPDYGVQSFMRKKSISGD